MLSKKAQKVYQYIIRSKRENGFPPTLREIGGKFGIASTNGVRYFIQVLERDGYIHRSSRISRGLEIPENGLRRFVRIYGSEKLGSDAEELDGIPILGRVAAGAPILATDHVEGHLNLNESFASRSTRFALRVKGDSMIEVGIFEDDVVVVKQTDHADNGAIVVALIEEEATVKILRKHSDRVELWPANKRYKPIVIHDAADLRILGTVMGLVRPAMPTSIRYRFGGSSSKVS